MGFLNFLKTKELVEIAQLKSEIAELQNKLVVQKLYESFAIAGLAFNRLKESFETVLEGQSATLVSTSELLAKYGSLPSSPQPTGPSGACAFIFETVMIRFGLDAKMKKMGNVETAVPYIVEGLPVKFKRLFPPEKLAEVVQQMYLSAVILRESYEQPKTESPEPGSSESPEPGSSETI